MEPASRLALATVLTLLLVGCAADGQQRVDPSERIDFRIPADWEEAPGSNGTRFSPPGGESRSAHINVNTGDLNPSVSLERERESWLAAQVSAGHEVLSAREWQHGDFEVLNVARDAYPEYREIFLQTVGSISAR